jgi:hypothetical protein
MYGLTMLSNTIDIHRVTVQVDTKFDKEVTYCVSNITVYAGDGEEIKIFMGNHLLERGNAINGKYEVRIFRNGVFPYMMYPTLRVEGKYEKIQYKNTVYDSLLFHALYIHGAWYCNLENIIMFPPCTPDNNKYVVIECEELPKLSESIGMTWIKDLIIPGTNTKYIIKSKSDKCIPCMLVPKLLCNRFISIITKYHGVKHVYVSNRVASDVLKQHGEKIKQLIRMLCKSST